MSDIFRMKKTELLDYACELETKLKKAETELAQLRIPDKIRDIHVGSYREGFEFGLEVAGEEITFMLDNMKRCGNHSPALCSKIQDAVW